MAAVLALVVGLGTMAACGDGSSGSDRPKATPQVKTLPTRYVPSVKRPNMLVIETDDMRWDELKFMPNVRKLIEGRGLAFENSFAPYPLCCPSRASFLTGKYAHNHHVLSHVDPFGFQAFDDRTTLATVLHGGGYQTALVGKYLNGYARQHVHGSTEPSLRYVPPGWDQWMAGSDKLFPAGDPRHGGTYNYFSMTQNINGQVVPHRGIYSTRLLADQVQDVVGGFSKKPDPWFVWWTPVAPHFGTPHEPDDPAPVLRDDGVLGKFATPARPRWVRGLFDGQVTHPPGIPPVGPVESDMSDKPRYLRKLPDINVEEKAALTKVSRQRAEALFVLDQQIGVVLQRLQRLGEYDDTVVAFTSDNGYYLGEHRKRVGKILAHEPSLRVPFLIAGPGIKHGKRYDPITSIDLAPTFADYAGLKGVPDADGVSLVRTIEKGDQGWNRPVVTEGRMGDRSYVRHAPRQGFDTALNERGVRTARWKYVRYSTGEVELYDLKNDPLELQSRQADPAYDRVRHKLERIWEQYYNCKGAGCAEPLPPEFRATAAQTKAITDNEFRRTRAYYVDYPLR